MVVMVVLVLLFLMVMMMLVVMVMIVVTAARIMVMVVMLMLVLILVVMMAAAAHAVLIVVVMMLVLFHGLTGLLQQGLHKVILTLHGLQDLRTGQLVPVGGHDGGLGVLLPQHGHGLLDLFLAGRAGAAQ